MTSRTCLRLLPCIALLIAGPSSEAACPNWDAKQRFTVAPRGTGVMDNLTGYIWFRCAVGQQWDPAVSSCTGPAYRAPWQYVKENDAQVHAHGYRLPTQQELAQLVEKRPRIPFIDPLAFPNTPPGSYWTAEAYAAWNANVAIPAGMIDFSGGQAREDLMSKGTGFYLRYIMVPGSAESRAAGFPDPGPCRPRQVGEAPAWMR